MHNPRIERIFSYFDNWKSVFSLIIGGAATVVLKVGHFVELDMNILFALLSMFIWFAATVLEHGLRHLKTAPRDTEL